MLYIELVLLGISLSIDAFSLAVSIGLNKMNINQKKYSLIVGIFHFLMPIFGYILKLFINKIIYLPSKEIFILVLTFLIIGILFEKNKSEKNINPLIFALSVSIDSFVIGFTINKQYILASSIIFSFISFLFTYIGFNIADKIKIKFKDNSKIISILILIIILVYNLLN